MLKGEKKTTDWASMPSAAAVDGLSSEEEEEEEEERSVTDCQTGGGWEITGVLAQQPTCLITPLSF